MLGISLRLDNPSRNHCFGSLGRLGRALAETQQPRELERRLLSVVVDFKLDAYSRILAYYLFIAYNHYLEDKPIYQHTAAKLNAAVQKLPPYLAARAVVKVSK
jgi:hypothetical protein